MALSDDEQRKLDEIARSLRSEDPALSTVLATGKVRHRRPIVAAALFVAGIVALVAGVVTAQWLAIVGVVIGVIGFVVMVGGAYLFAAGRVRSGQAAGSGPGSSGRPRFRDRMQKRFRSRFDKLDE